MVHHKLLRTWLISLKASSFKILLIIISSLKETCSDKISWAWHGSSVVLEFLKCFTHNLGGRKIKSNVLSGMLVSFRNHTINQWSSYFPRFVCLFEKHRYGESGSGREEGRERLSFICCFTPHWLQWPGLGHAEARRLGLHWGMPHGCRDPNTWVFFCCFHRSISRQLDLNLHLHGTSVSQVP